MHPFRMLPPLVIATFLLAACHSVESRPSPPSVPRLSREDSFSNNVLQLFSLPYTNIAADSTLLIFYCSQPQGNSSLLELRPDRGIVRGAFYEMRFPYHRFLHDYADTSTQLLFFDGYHFVLDTATWAVVVQQAHKILFARDPSVDTLKIADNPSYGLYYGGLSKHGDGHYALPYEQFDSLLKSRFLTRFQGLRKPVGERPRAF